MKTRFLALALALALCTPSLTWARPGQTPGKVPAAAQNNARAYRLSTTKVQGKVYYRTFRVTSKAGFKRISDKGNGFRFFQGGGQYGEAFYLFRTRGAARKFAKAEAKRGAKDRNVIAEVLLPKDKFDKVTKKVVPAKLDWSMQKARTDPGYNSLRDLRLNSHILMGKWARSPHADEPIYEPLVGAKQLAVVQRGAPSILQEAVIRLHEPAPAK